MIIHLPVSGPAKISVKLPLDEWLCRKMEKLNLTLTEGYPYLAAKTSAIKKQGFSEATEDVLRLLKEDQLDQSMNQVDHFYKLVPQ